MSNETERTLHELKLPGMASCWSSLEETHQLDKLTLREGMQIMLQYERDTRGNNRIQRLIKNAGFRLRASMEELETDTARGIQACSAADLATGNYITGGMTVRQQPVHDQPRDRKRLVSLYPTGYGFSSDILR